MLELKKNEKQVTINIQNEAIKVDIYKSTYEKQSIIDAALQNAYNENIKKLDRMVFDSTFYALLVLRYTDIKIKIKDIEDMAICDLYDLLESNEIIHKVLEAIKEEDVNEIKELINYADLAYEEFKESINSASTAVNSLVVGMTQSLASIVSAAKVIENNK